MLAATKVKMSGSEKKSDQVTYDISSIKRVSRKFLGVSRSSRAKQRQRSVQKSVLDDFWLIRPTDFFWPFSLPSTLRITRFYILFE